MAILKVNPTRMELTRLKTRLRTAKRGHKLLKDKRDEMIKQFLDLVNQTKELRLRVEQALGKIQGGFSVAAALMSAEALEEALIFPGRSAELEVSEENILSVVVPKIQCTVSEDKGSFPYGFAFTSGELDSAVRSLSALLPDLIHLAQAEKAVKMLAADIEKTRRRVNALEHVMIPQLEETVRYIVMKLDENERGNLTRLMKVKDMMLEEARQAEILADQALSG